MKKIFVIAPIILAIVVLVVLVKIKEDPKKHTLKSYKNAQVIQVKKQDVNLIINSFGTTSSKVDLNIISAVSGDITYINPKLENGNEIAKGELLIQIDPKEYGLNIKNLEAEILKVGSNIQELKSEIEITKTLLEIENKRLDIEKVDLQRYKDTKKFISAQTLAKYENIVLSRQSSIINLSSKLKTLPLKIKAHEANIKALNAKKDIVKISLNDCSIKMPIDGIIYDKAIEKAEYITKGKMLLKVYDKNNMEIEVDIPISKLKKFKNPNIIKDVDAQFFSSSLNRYYKANFSRTGAGIDEKIRTLKLVFTLNEPILKGLFLDVKILAQELKDVISIPKELYHDGIVYLADAEKLNLKKVNILYEDRDFYVIDGVKEGDNIITTNLKAAVQGRDIKVIK